MSSASIVSVAEDGRGADAFASVVGPWMDLIRHCAGPGATHVLDTAFGGTGAGREAGFDRTEAEERGRQLVCLPGALPLPRSLDLVRSTEADRSATFVVVDDAGEWALAVITRCPHEVSSLISMSKGNCARRSPLEVARALRAFPCDCLPVPSDVQELRLDAASVGRADAGSVFDSDDQWHRAEAEMRQHSFLLLDMVGAPESSRYLPLDFYLREPCVIGAYGRMMQRSQEPPGIPPHGTANNLSLADVDVVAVTTDRWRSCLELFRSIRDVLGPQPTITLVAQTGSGPRWRYLARRFHARIIHVEHDLGLSASRNIAVESGSRKLVWLMDDDFQLDSRCRAHTALELLSNHPSIDVLAGNLLDAEHWSTPNEKEVSQGFAMRLVRQAPDLLWIRLEDLPRRREFVDSCTYVEAADIVDNFALFRRATTFDRGFRWNPALKINAEHQDLYLKFRHSGDVRVMRTNALRVRNVRVQPPRYRALRNRQHEFFTEFFQSHSLTSFRILGGWQRILCTDGRLATRALDSPWGHKTAYQITRKVDH